MDSQTRVKDNSELHPLRRGQPTTHASIKQLSKDLQLAVKGFLPKISTPYKKVTCILIAWLHAYQQNEGGVQQDFDDFRDLVQNHYHFEVDEYLIDRTKTQRTIEMETLIKCTQAASRQDELLIIYYAGHSYYQEWSRHTIFSAHRMNDPDPWKRQIDFHQSISYVLNLSEGDVLYVIDACYSCSIAVTNSRETLAASAIEMTSDARLKGLQSFTQAFCQTIRADPSPATVAQIHARLISQWQDTNKGNYLQTTPVHKAAASFDTSSIILAPSNVSSVTLKSDQSDTAKVLIKVTLDDTIPPNLAEWRNWLRRQIPTNVAKIEVEGVFEANSKVVLLRLPVAIWDMLPDHDAYSFVGYVLSSNLVVKELETVVKELETTVKEHQTALSEVLAPSLSLPTNIRNPKKENIPPARSVEDQSSSLLWIQGRYSDAETLASRIVQLISSKTFEPLQPPHHDFPQAERLFQLTRAREEKVLGPNHADTIEALTSLANVYIHQGRHSEAEILLHQNLKAIRAELGPTHPETLRMTENLAGVYRLQGRDEAAKELCQETLDMEGMSPLTELTRNLSIGETLEPSKSS